MRLLAIFIITLILLPALLIADVINVPDDQETIQGAIDAAENGDTVLVQPGEYIEYPNFDGKRITVASLYLTTGDESHITETIVDGNGEGRIFSFRSGETEESILCGFTIRNGETTYGGGIYVNGAAPTLKNLIINNNHATNRGGGVYATQASSPILINVTIYGNSSDEPGGGLRVNAESTINMINSVVWNNDPPELQNDWNITYSDIEGDYNGQGNIESDPRFVDADAHDFRLADNSPCIDSGDPDLPDSPDGTRSDMGALSFNYMPSLTVEPEQLNFRIRVGTVSEQSFTVTNVGEVTAHIESITLDGGAPFSFEEIEGAIELDPNEEYEVVVTYAPEEEGEQNSTIQIATDDPDNERFEVALSGFGEPPVPQIVYDPEAIDNGAIPIRVSSSQELRIENAGDALLIVESISIAGEDEAIFSIDVDEFELDPDGVRIITVTATPVNLSEFNADLTIVSNDPDRGEIEVALSGSGVLPDAHYQFTSNTGANHTILVTEVTVDGEALEIGNGIGVFSPEDLCCGAVIWLDEQAGLVAWGDNEMTEEVDGLQEDEQMTFKVWDYVAEQEYVADPEFIQNERINGDDVFHEDGLTILTLSVTPEEVIGFTLQMRNGWNLISAPIIPEDDDVRAILRDVVEREHLVILKNQNGRFYVPALNFSNLPPWDFRQGYQARLSSADSLLVVGEFADEETPIPLRAGWNMVAYLPEQEIAAPVAFENVNDIMIIAKDVNGRFYVPALGFSNMGSLRRGQGYQANLSEESELVWSVPDQFLPGASPSDENNYSPTVMPTGSNMSLLIQQIPDLPADGIELLLQTPAGLTIGAGKLSGDGPWGLAIWGDDQTTDDIDGALESEAVILTVRHNDRTIDADANWIKGDGTYQKDALTIADINLTDGTTVANDFHLSEPYPNPFNSTTKLSFSLVEDGNVELVVSDVTGRLVSTLLSQPLKAGHHEVSFDAESLPSGVYIAQLKSGTGVVNVKMMLLR